MNISRFDLDFELMSPLAHFGDEMCGTMQTARRMKYKINNKFVDIPVYSGNALRGILRSLVFEDMLEKCGMSVKSITQAVFYTIFNGGSLKSGGIENLDFKEKITECCPPLVLLGSAYGSQMTEGKAKVGIVRPVCKEMNNYNRNKSEQSLYSGMVSEIFQTRHDRLKISDENVKDVKEVPKETVQMKYEFETLSPGTKMETEISVEYASSLEKSCMAYMIELLKKSAHIGGKSSEGYGMIYLDYSNSDNITSKEYETFLDENVENIKEFFELLGEYVS